MAEAFGLDRKIEKYQGRLPIEFYRWDLDLLRAMRYSIRKEAQRRNWADVYNVIWEIPV